MRFAGRSLLLTSIAVIYSTGALSAADRYVDEQWNGGDNLGTATDPFEDRTGIQDAIDAAGEGDTIHVAGGSYAGFTLDSAPAGGPGINVVIKKDNAWGPPSGATGNVVIEPGAGPEAVDPEHAAIVIKGQQSSATILSGLIIEDWRPVAAGAVCILPLNIQPETGPGSHPRIEFCTIRNNSASTLGSYGGAGMLIGWDCDPVIYKCTFSGNTFRENQAGYGAALWIYAAFIGGGGSPAADRYPDPTIDACTFRDNLSTNSADGKGGAIAFTKASGSIVNCTFSRNKASSYGGAIYVHLSDGVVIDNCSFVSNELTGVDGEGGTIAIEGIDGTEERIRISDCSIKASKALVGGAISVEDSIVTVNHMKCSGNFATGTGATGGFLAAFASAGMTTDLLAVNNLVYGSDAVDAAGSDGNLCTFWVSTEGENASLTARFVNCTIAGNSDRAISASEWASGSLTSSLSLIMHNGILWGNGSQSSPSIKSDIGAGTVTLVVRETDSEQSFTGTGNLSADPLFVSASNFHLSASSPCIGTGLDLWYNAATGTDPTIPNLDLDEEDRFVSTIDMGCYEVQ